MIVRLFALSSGLMLLGACGGPAAPASSKTPIAHAETECHDEHCTGHQAASEKKQIGATVCGNGLIEVFRSPGKEDKATITIKLLSGQLADPVSVGTEAGSETVKVPATKDADGEYTDTLPVNESSKTLWIMAGQGEKAVQVDFPLVK